MAQWATTNSVVAMLTRLGVDLTEWEPPSYSPIAELILVAQAEFERRTNRLFEFASTTEKLDGSGVDALVVSGYPIITLNGIVIVGYPSTPVLSYSISDVETDTNRGIIFLTKNPAIFPATVWPRGNRNIEIDYDYGYYPGPAPANNFPVDILETIRYMAIIAVIVQTPSPAQIGGLEQIKIMDYMEKFGKSGIYAAQITTFREKIDETVNYYRKIFMGTP